MSRNPVRKLSRPDKPVPAIVARHETFAENLHRALLERGWSQSELARRVWNEIRQDSKGNNQVVGRDRISAYCRGTLPEPATLKRIADVLRMTVEDLAPDIAASVVQKENPSVSIQMLAGHEDKCLLKINRLVSFSTAIAVGKLIEEDSKN